MIRSLREEVPAIVWSVGRMNEPGMDEDRRRRRDVELHKKFVHDHGAVFWSAGWERHYTKEPLNGYLYMSQEGLVKYRLRIEKIIQNNELTPDDKRLVPKWREAWINKIPTWIKITDITKLLEAVDPTSMIKWADREPIKSRSALQSAVKIVDEFWE